MESISAVIVRRAVETGGGPPHLVHWVRTQARQLTVANRGTPLPKDLLVSVLAPRLAAALERVSLRGAATVAKQAGETSLLE